MSYQTCFSKLRNTKEKKTQDYSKVEHQDAVQPGVLVSVCRGSTRIGTGECAMGSGQILDCVFTTCCVSDGFELFFCLKVFFLLFLFAYLSYLFSFLYIQIVNCLT